MATWATYNRTGSTHPLRDCICVGPGKFVAVGTAGKVVTSGDGGVTWVTRTAASANDWGGLAFDGTTIVAVGTGAGTRVMFSTDDGHTWTAATTVPEANTWNAVCSPAAGTFLAVASSGTHRVMKSTDSGVTWSAISASSALPWSGVAAGGGLIVAYASSGTQTTMVSSDGGSTWTSYGTSPLIIIFFNATGSQVIQYSAALGKFLIGGYSTVPSIKTHIIGSADGQTWSDVVTLLTTEWGWYGWRPTDSIGGFIGSTPVSQPPPGVVPTPTIICWSVDSGTTWTLDDTTFSAPNGWAACAWDPSTYTVVFFNDSTEAVLVGTFTPPATVSAISPNIGSTLGGTAVTITGTGFTGSPSVTIGGVAATSVVVVNSTTITCVTGAHAAGLVNVVAQGGTLVNGYTYTAAPILESITPDNGPILGGTAVTITGQNFDSTMALVILDAGGAVINLIDRVDVSSTSITGTMPAHAAGLVSLFAQNEFGDDTLDGSYIYTNSFAGGDNIFGTYSLLRNDPSLQYSEQSGGIAQITYGALGTGAPERPRGLDPISMTDPNTGDLLGKGLNLQITQAWMEGPSTPSDPLPYVKWSTTATDRRWLLNRRVVTGAWSQVRADVIVSQVLAQYAPAFSADGVQPGLDPISIQSKRTYRVADFLDAVCTALGGASWFLDPATDVVYLGFSLQAGLNPTRVDDSNPYLLRDSSIEYSEDWSQIRNRVHVKGQLVAKKEGTFEQKKETGGPGFFNLSLARGLGNMDMTFNSWTADYLLAYVMGPNSPTSIQTVAYYAPGQAAISVIGWAQFQQGEEITVANVQGAVPDVNGNYTIDSMFGNAIIINFDITTPGTGGTVVSAEPSGGGLVPGANIGIPINPWSILQTPPTTIPNVVNSGFGSDFTEPQAGHTYAFKYTFGKFGFGLAAGESVVSSETAPSPASNTITSDGSRIFLDSAPEDSTEDAGLVYRIWYVSKDGGPFLHIAGDPTTPWPNERTSTPYPSGSSISFDWDYTSGDIPVSGSATSNNAIRITSIPLSLNPQCVAINVYRAKQRDPNLYEAGNIYGKVFYYVDQIVPGYSLLPGNTEYLDTKADSELGDPYPGNTPGTHPWSTETTYEIWATVNDAASQALVAERLGGDDDGVIEFIIDDPTLTTIGDLTKRGQAELDMWALPVKTVKGSTRDRKFRRGRDATFNLTNPPISDNGSDLILRIQDVTIDQIHENNTLVPRYSFVCSNQRYTLADLLNRVQLTKSTTQASGGGVSSSSSGVVVNNPGYSGQPATNLATFNEIPSGSVDGSNTTFTVARAFLPGSLQYYLNGVRQTPGDDFTETAAGFIASFAPHTGDRVMVDYRG